MFLPPQAATVQAQRDQSDETRVPLVRAPQRGHMLDLVGAAINGILTGPVTYLLYTVANRFEQLETERVISLGNLYSLVQRLKTLTLCAPYYSELADFYRNRPLAPTNHRMNVFQLHRLSMMS
jgi:hypothetical protein